MSQRKLLGDRRPALRQRPDPHRSSGRVHPDRYLGALSEAARSSLHLHLCRRHARHGDHDPCAAGRSQRRGLDRRNAASRICAISGRLTSSSTITAARTATRIASCAANSGRRCGRRDLVVENDVAQLFDPEAGTFLADRFVKGTCPKCRATDQYGDNCDKCGCTYRATDLIDPVSTLSGAKPEVRSRAAPVRGTGQAARLSDRVDAVGRAPAGRGRQLSERTFPERAACGTGTSRGRPPTSASRFPTVPATTGTSGSTRRSATSPRPSSGAIGTASRSTIGGAVHDVEIHHFIGKDITYFHTLFWPGMLKSAGFSLPTKVHIHGFLTVGGEKMSKSKGTFVMADHVPAASRSRPTCGTTTPRSWDPGSTTST